MSKRKQSSTEPSQRQLRVGEQLRHIIAETIRRGHFGREELLDIHGITVSEVQTSPDLKHAVAYVIGDDIKELLPMLNEEAYMFQKEIGQNSGLKFTPKVKFRIDESFENSQRINELLGELDLPKGNDGDGGDGGDGNEKEEPE